MNAEFKIGDIVKVSGNLKDEDDSDKNICGGAYTTFDKFFQEYGLEEFSSRYCYDEDIYDGIYKILDYKPHPSSMSDTMVYILEDMNTKGIYLLCNDEEEMSLNIW